jgi:hypothetical protein
MSPWIKDAETPIRLHEIRRFQVYRLERRRRRPLFARMRRTVFAPFHRERP